MYPNTITKFFRYIFCCQCFKNKQNEINEINLTDIPTKFDSSVTSPVTSSVIETQYGVYFDNPFYGIDEDLGDYDKISEYNYKTGYLNN